MFRYEEPQSGRYREFWQAGVELLGSGSVEADAEVIALFVESYLATGLKDFTVNVGDRVLLDEFARMLGVEDDVGLMRLIDKKDKLSREEFTAALRDFGLDDDGGVEKVLSLIGIKGGKPDDVLPPKAEELFTGKKAEEEIRRLYDLTDLLEAYGVREKVLIDLGIARGFRLLHEYSLRGHRPPERPRDSSVGGRREVRQPHRGLRRQADPGHGLRDRNRKAYSNPRVEGPHPGAEAQTGSLRYPPHWEGAGAQKGRDKGCLLVQEGGGD